MASQGPKDPSAAAQSATPSQDWLTITNVFASDDARATCSLATNTTTETLRVTGFGFTVPAGATIDGIVVEVERHASSTTLSPHDNKVRLVKDGSTEVGTDQKSATTWPLADAYATYGTSSDLWGTTWTDTDVNASTFGLAFQASRSAGKSGPTVRVDHVRITVYYTDPVGQPTVKRGGGVPGMVLGGPTFGGRRW